MIQIFCSMMISLFTEEMISRVINLKGYPLLVFLLVLLNFSRGSIPNPFVNLRNVCVTFQYWKMTMNTNGVFLKAFYFPRMGRSQELPNQGMEDGGMSDELCCTLGVSRVWSPSDPEPRHVCPAAKCCPDLTSTVYVGSNLSVYELCVPDKVWRPFCAFVYWSHVII